MAATSPPVSPAFHVSVSISSFRVPFWSRRLLVSKPTCARLCVPAGVNFTRKGLLVSDAAAGGWRELRAVLCLPPRARVWRGQIVTGGWPKRPPRGEVGGGQLLAAAPSACADNSKLMVAKVFPSLSEILKPLKESTWKETYHMLQKRTNILNCLQWKGLSICNLGRQRLKIELSGDNCAEFTTRGTFTLLLLVLNLLLIPAGATSAPPLSPSPPGNYRDRGRQRPPAIALSPLSSQCWAGEDQSHQNSRDFYNSQILIPISLSGMFLSMVSTTSHEPNLTKSDQTFRCLVGLTFSLSRRGSEGKFKE